MVFLPSPIHVLYSPWPRPSQLRPSPPLPPTTTASCPCNRCQGSHPANSPVGDPAPPSRRGRRLDGIPPASRGTGRSRTQPATAGSLTSHCGRVKLKHAGGERLFEVRRRQNSRPCTFSLFVLLAGKRSSMQPPPPGIARLRLVSPCPILDSPSPHRRGVPPPLPVTSSKLWLYRRHFFVGGHLYYICLAVLLQVKHVISVLRH
nr:uncharacterized protein LOC127335939 [Lolium perenne]